MTIEKAIEVLQESKIYPMPVSITDVATAKQLGIEALKRLHYTRQGSIHDYTNLLPGETKE